MVFADFFAIVRKIVKKIINLFLQPPKKTIKKTEKEKAAELKKKNTAIAEDIIATVMQQSECSSVSEKSDKSLDKAVMFE